MELIVPIHYIVNYTTVEPEVTNIQKQRTPFRRIQNPLIYGIRFLQFATGSHYKVRSILRNLEIRHQDVICAGDGSGGISSYILRSSKSARVIFKSLLGLDGVELRGTAPSPPSAIRELGTMSSRCVNFQTCWENPNDLAIQGTRDYFLFLKQDSRMHIDLIIIDMETNDDYIYDQVEVHLGNYIFQILENSGTLIFKTYADRIYNRFSTLMEVVGPQFQDVGVVTTEISSSQTSEV